MLIALRKRPLLPISLIRRLNVASNQGILDMYEGKLGTKIRRLKLFSLSSSTILGSALTYGIIDKGIDTTSGLVGAFTAPYLLSPILIGWIFKRYALNLHYDRNRELYTLQYYGLLLNKRKMTFKRDEVSLADVSKFLSTFEVQGQPFYVDEEDLKSADAVQAYKRMVKLDTHDKMANKP